MWELEFFVNFFKGLFNVFKILLKPVVGFYVMILWVVLGIVSGVTIVGIPFAKMCFRNSTFMFYYPNVYKEATIYINRKEAPVKNAIWCCTVGFIMTLVHVLFGAMLCATLIAFPLGIAYFKSIKYVIMPFGAEFSLPEYSEEEESDSSEEEND